MSAVRTRVDQLDVHLTAWMARYSIPLLRSGLGVVFFWFGVLKFYPGLSPAQELATRTISVLTFDSIQPAASLPFLAAWECLIGLGLIAGRWTRITLLLLWSQMLGTLTPLLLFPGEAFVWFPLVPTLEGQYIIKNVVLVSAGLVIGATARGGRLVADPEQSLRPLI